LPRQGEEEGDKCSRGGKHHASGRCAECLIKTEKIKALGRRKGGGYGEKGLKNKKITEAGQGKTNLRIKVLKGKKRGTTADS